MRNMNWLKLILSAATLYSTMPAAGVSPPFIVQDGVRVVTGNDFAVTIEIDGAEWNNAIIRENTFAGQTEFGMEIANVSGLRIENNTFSGISRNAIKLKDWDNTGANNVTIIGNRFSSMAQTPILVGLPNRGVRIIDNHFDDVAWSTDGERQHAMYIKAPGYLIEGNVINTVRGANGISVRTAGVVRRNWITNVAEDGIKYYADQPDKGDGLLLIENNVVLNSQHGGIGFDAAAGAPVDHAVVRFNTLVNNYRSLRFDPDVSLIKFTIYGNLLVEPSGKWTYGSSQMSDLTMVSNITSVNPTELFVNFNAQDLRLKADSIAIRSVLEIPPDPFGLPKTDFYNVPYDTAPYDAGACRFGLPSPSGLTLGEFQDR